MKRWFGKISLGLVVLYVGLHLVLGSSPVQKRVVEEVRTALRTLGLELRIESIEFSALSPKIYLNRVTLSPLPQAEVPLTDPLVIDKIKIEFRPLALLFKRVVISEVVLFHPRVVLPDAGKLYRKVTRFLGTKTKPSVKGGDFTVVLERFGVVDAFVDVVSQDPPFAVRSRSFSAFLDNTTPGQQNFSVQSPHLELERGKAYLAATRVDVDVDVTAKSLRVNRAVVEGQDLLLSGKGSASLPYSWDKKTGAIQGSFEVKVPLVLLASVEELKSLPAMKGKVSASGSLRLAGATSSGAGSLRYDGVEIDGYGLGAGVLSYALTENELQLKDLALRYSDGEVRGKKVTLGLSGDYPLVGELQISGVRLESILANVKSPGVPIRFPAFGTVAVQGRLKNGFRMQLEPQVSFPEFIIYDTATPDGPEDEVVRMPAGKAAAKLQFTEDQLAIQGSVDVLSGKLSADGVISLANSDMEFQFRGDKLSLTQLRKIAGLNFGGNADLSGQIAVIDGRAQIVSSVSTRALELEDIVLGNVRGQIQFNNNLMSFDDLVVEAAGPVAGRGYVDFGDSALQYRFDVDVKRAEVDQIFTMFQKTGVGFRPPRGGELQSKLVLKGGSRDPFTVQAVGSARNLSWYDERWVSSRFQFSYQPKNIQIERVLLVKPGGGLEVKGKLVGEDSTLTFASLGLKLAEFDRANKVPIAGELSGAVTFKGPLADLAANGALKLVKTSFRGNLLEDSEIRLRHLGQETEILGNIVGERMKGRIARVATAPGNSTAARELDVLLYFKAFDFTPTVALLLAKDIPTFAEISATGELALRGNFADWRSVTGSGTLSELLVGLKGTPLRNESPVQIEFDRGTVRVARTSLRGRDGQLNGQLTYLPNDSIDAKIDGRLDMEFVQPFIPGLELAKGKVSASLRFSGKTPGYSLLGSAILEDGTLRIKGLNEEIRSAQAQISLSQDRMNVDRFESLIGGGSAIVSGDVKIDRFQTLAPNLKIVLSRVGMRTTEFLTTKVSGDFSITGSEPPYRFAGNCRLHEARLSKLQASTAPGTAVGEPDLAFDIRCRGDDKLFVDTDIIDGEFRGDFHVVGDTEQIGLLGTTESLRGALYFSGTKFDLTSANVKFESANEILPRFNVAGNSRVKEKKSQGAQEYDVSLQAFGTPTDYKIRLSSSPSLAESEIIALLVLGAPSRGTEDPGYLDLGSAIAGQNPISSKLQSELGLAVQFGKKPGVQTAEAASVGADPNVPNVQVQKDVTDKTKLSVSNTLESVPQREFRLEQMLDDNFSLSGSVGERNRGSVTESQSVRSYGLDFRYRFSFE